mmetsp:Transcript_831/g.1622  ORF Transcript_831/g.1622 Transcript_831/m.1622 type:complete len:89 (+) Transcript_831:996-1262(+)
MQQGGGGRSAGGCKPALNQQVKLFGTLMGKFWLTPILKCAVTVVNYSILIAQCPWLHYHFHKNVCLLVHWLFKSVFCSKPQLYINIQS